MTHKIPDAVEQKIIALLAEQGLTAEGISRIDETPPVTLRPSDYSAKRAEKLVFLFHFDKQKTDPTHDTIAIQNALGRVPMLAETFNGLRPRPFLSDVVAGLEKDFPVKQAPAEGLTAEDYAMLRNWQGTKSKDSWGEWGPKVESSTESAVALTYKFEKPEDAVTAMANLKLRAPAILQQIKEAAAKSTHLTEAQKQELNQLQIMVKEHTSPGWEGSSVQLVLGLPAAQKGPGDEVMLKASALNTLMSNPDAKVSSAWNAILRHGATYSGDKWMEAFPLLAGSEEVKGYLNNRVAQLTDDKLKGAIADMLTRNAFLSDKEKDERRKKHADADFKLSPPTEEHLGTYRLRLTLPGGMKPEQVYESVLATPTQNKTPEKSDPDSLTLAGDAVLQALQASKVADPSGRVIPMDGAKVLVQMADGKDGAAQQSVAVQVSVSHADTVHQEQVRAAMLAVLGTVPSLKGITPHFASWKGEDDVSLTFDLPGGVQPASVVAEIQRVANFITDANALASTGATTPRPVEAPADIAASAANTTVVNVPPAVCPAPVVNIENTIANNNVPVAAAAAEAKPEQDVQTDTLAGALAAKEIGTPPPTAAEKLLAKPLADSKVGQLQNQTPSVAGMPL